MGHDLAAPAGVVRRAPGRLAQGPALAVAVAAVIVLAAGVLAVVTWTGGAAPGHPSATTAGGPSAGIAQPGPAGSPSASASGPGQQGDQLTAGDGNVASVPMSALPSGGGGSGTIVALVIVTGVPSVSVKVAAMPGTLVQATTGGGYGARPVLDDLPGASQSPGAGRIAGRGGRAVAAPAPGDGRRKTREGRCCR